MKALVEKVLKSGIVDRGMAEMLERWGNLPNGAADLVKNDALIHATKNQLEKIAEVIGDAVEEMNTIRETRLDLDKIQWPTQVSILPAEPNRPGPTKLIKNIPAVMDRMGRLFFRFQDVREDWFIPGFVLMRTQHMPNEGVEIAVLEQVLERTTLFAEEKKIVLEVTVAPFEMQDLPSLPEGK